jgi:hypothetical protein
MTTNSALNYALTAQITLLDGLITGLREIHSLGSILQVRAAPFAELESSPPSAPASSPTSLTFSGSKPAMAGARAILATGLARKPSKAAKFT